jgi:hypothetical protein
MRRGLRDVKLARVRSLSSLVCHPSRGFVFVLIILYSLDLEYDSALFRSASMSGTDYYAATNPLARQSRGMCDFYMLRQNFVFYGWYNVNSWNAWIGSLPE